MKVIVLDTHIIVQDPTVLAHGSEGLRIVVPGPVLTQLERMRGRDVHPRLTEVIRRAAQEKSIVIVNPTGHAADIYPELDPIDTAILNVARDFKDHYSDTLLITKDIQLRDVASRYGVDSGNLDRLRAQLTAAAPVNANVMADARKAITLRWVVFVSCQLLAIASAFGLIWFLSSYQEVREKIGVVWLVIIMAALSIVLYAFRAWCRFSYGVAEVVFGFAAVWYSLTYDLAPEGGHSVGMVKLGASLYIVVRGLDNMQRGLKDTTAEGFWGHWFPT